jgi:Tol biopolymer transport system component
MTDHMKPRGWNRIEELLKNDAFQAEVKSVRRLDSFNRIPHISRLLADFEIPTTYYRFISNLVEFNQIDQGLVGDYVKVDTSDGVSLNLSFDTTQPELMHFIATHWTDKIKPNLVAISGDKRRVNSTFAPTRDRRAYDDYKNRKQLNKTVAEIAEDHSLTEDRLRKIVRRYRSN